MSSSNAQTPVSALNPDQLHAESDLLFKRILLDPRNLDASFRYAEVSTALGDYEAAIGSLERMLFYARDLPRVRLELGLLYFRLGSYEMARSHFNAALASPTTPVDVRARIDSFLREIDKRLNPAQSSIFFQTGMRYQSNANAGPDSASVRALGFDATLGSQFRRQSDWNLFGVLSGRFIYDFENQRGDAWETDVTGYYSKQITFARLDLGLAEIATGPRLGVPGVQGLSIRPYMIGTTVSLGSANYMQGMGGGVSARYQNDQITVEPGFEFRSRSFSTSTNYPTATDQDGHQSIASVSLGSPFGSLTSLKWQAKFTGNRTQASLRAYGYRQAGIELALPWEFDSPIANDSRRWTLAPFAAYFDTSYDQPNALVDPTLRRRDREWRVGTTVDMALFGNYGFAIQVLYSSTASNLPNYRTHNLIVSAGPTARF